MSDGIIYLFIVLSALALGLSLFFIWRSLRGLFDAGPAEPREASGERERSE
mgnify:CR=1 FL=1|jgi:pilus assembly protein TadC